MEKIRKCKFCLALSSITKFPKWGLVCKPCTSKQSIAWGKENPKRKYESNKRYLSTPLGKLAVQRKTRMFRKKFPKKYAAYNAVVTAIRNKTLIRKICEICGVKNTHAHHDDYNKPLDVRWLCDLCHVRLHRSMLKARQ